MPMCSSRMTRSTSPGSHTSTRWISDPLISGMRKAFSIPMKWPTGAPVTLGGRSAFAIAASWRTSNPSVRWEWITPLGLRVVPDVKPMTAGPSGSAGSGASIGSASSRSSKGWAPSGSGPVAGTHHEPPVAADSGRIGARLAR